jgi:hypothetical protein
MAERKLRDVWQYGDFQTPPELAAKVCNVLLRFGVKPKAILEPSCGRGAFLLAAAAVFPQIRTMLGVDINVTYVAEARARLHASGARSASVEQGDFFTTNWDVVLTRDEGPWLVLGNPPWVTNADLGLLNSANLPVKSNFQGHQGLDAITGKANFDISEWMLLQQLNWLKKRSGWIAILVKTSVARKVLRHAWKKREPVGRASIFKIDAQRFFGAAVEACLLVLPVGLGDASQDCDVYPDLSAQVPSATIGLHDGLLVSDVAAFSRHRPLLGPNRIHIWRSGAKHDCSKVMELSASGDGCLINGFGEKVVLEDTFLFPLLKSSDVANGRGRASRYMIVTQTEIGQDTSTIKNIAPRTWDYLERHAPLLDARASAIYKNRPRFSMFGVGEYTFAPWKVAISGFYKNLRFRKIEPLQGKPVVFDDTVYFVPCWSEREADLIMQLVESAAYRALMSAMIFPDDKRPITAELLKRISLHRVAQDLGLEQDYLDCITSVRSPQTLELALPV